MAILNNYFADPADIKYNCLNVQTRSFVWEGFFGFNDEDQVYYTCNQGIQIFNNGELFTSDVYLNENYIKVVGQNTWARILKNEEIEGMVDLNGLVSIEGLNKYRDWKWAEPGYMISYVETETESSEEDGLTVDEMSEPDEEGEPSDESTPDENF